MDMNLVLSLILKLSTEQRPLREYEVMLHESLCGFVQAWTENMTKHVNAKNAGDNPEPIVGREED